MCDIITLLKKQQGDIMYKIVSKKYLNDTVCQMEIYAPYVTLKAKAGQFIILRVDAEGERVPLTIAGINKEKGLVTIIFQLVGASTIKLGSLNEGDAICDFVGPLGRPTKLDGLKKVCIVGGGVGCAIALPVARALKEMGVFVTSIIGFRNKDLVILEDEFKACSNSLTIMTDDGSYGRQGNVCIPLNEAFSKGETFDEVITIGPLIMMKFVTLAVQPTNIPCTCSMNSIMIDGTGMCGCCRLTLNQNGEKVTKFACVDGPDFNGYEIDFDEAMSRGSIYSEFEAKRREETCNLLKKGEEQNG